jgi:hypothetical protein
MSAARSRDLREARAAGRVAPTLAEWVRSQAEAIIMPALEGKIEGEHPLASLIDAEGFGGANFLRLSAGEADFEILSGLTNILARPSLLGVAIRLPLYGSDHPRENSFHNTDRLLRSLGYDLLGFEPTLYSAAALPSYYLGVDPAQTLTGRPIYAQGIYVRELIQAHNQSAAELAKAAALMSLFGVPDHAAELLLIHEDKLVEAGFDVAAGLDLLALQIQEPAGSTMPYRDYIARFEREDPRFFDIYSKRDAWLNSLLGSHEDAPARTAKAEAVARAALRELRALRGGVEPGAEAGKATILADLDRRSLLSPENHWIFDYFQPYAGPTPADCNIGYLGDRVQLKFFDVPDMTPLRHFVAPIPSIDEEYFEWIDLLQAVLEAGPTFTMLELGAGFGRWSARGALAARQLGKDIRLGVAEAEPRHQGWLHSHFEANGISKDRYALFDKAISGEAGPAVFMVGAPEGVLPDAWFGQQMASSDLAGLPVVGDYHGLPLYETETGWRCIEVEKIPLSQVLARYDHIDLIDFDLQGAEADAIGEAIDGLSAKVRRLHIGTHGHEIEADLRAILSAAGWTCLRDFECHGAHMTPFGPCDFVDGVQSWVNPRFF